MSNPATYAAPRSDSRHASATEALAPARPVTAPDHRRDPMLRSEKITPEHLASESLIVLRSGKKNYFLVHVNQ